MCQLNVLQILSYVLYSMVLEPSAEVEAITNLVKQNVPDAEEQRHHGKELTYTLPIASVSSFPSKKQ